MTSDYPGLSVAHITQRKKGLRNFGAPIPTDPGQTIFRGPSWGPSVRLFDSEIGFSFLLVALVPFRFVGLSLYSPYK